MANGDDFDPNPPGTITTFGGLGADNPLVDWASNMRPSDIQQYVHDPEGFKQRMIAAGQPPPNFDHDERGLPIMRDPSQGNLTSAAPLAYTDIPPKPEEAGPSPAVEAAKRRLEEFGKAKPYPPGEQPGTPPILRPAPPAAAPTAPTTGGIPTLQEIWRRGFGTYRPEAQPAPLPEQPKAPPLPAPTPVGAPPKVVPEPVDLDAGKKIDDVAEARKKIAQADKDKAEALSDFAKSVQGVKMPQRPQLPGVGTPGVRAPGAVHPDLSGLLAAVGQARPAANMSLMRLLGRA